MPCVARIDHSRRGRCHPSVGSYIVSLGTGEIARYCAMARYAATTLQSAKNLQSAKKRLPNFSVLILPCFIAHRFRTWTGGRQRERQLRTTTKRGAANLYTLGFWS